MSKWCSKVRTQSGPPGYGCGELDGCEEVAGQFVVTGGNSTPVLQAAEQSLDEITPLVDFPIEWVEACSGWIVWNDGCGASFHEECAQGICIVGGVSCAKSRRRQDRKKCLCGADIAKLAWGNRQGDWSSGWVADGVDLGRASATRSPDRLALRPPFPPAAERWALAVVLSMA